ncbi:hypothetical protein PMIN01_10417 [Paraphaeosphaeria minitans]|uniref:Uncharacterized protein n=1 Tax=Paraphaeosphaeria minitans TaxID=565426 RepID=A0A9P6GAH3_9PLEO|nr:hypothetical protein PMIN01_10417 [Paraphaeosphaeria minitans]
MRAISVRSPYVLTLALAESASFPRSAWRDRARVQELASLVYIHCSQRPVNLRPILGSDIGVIRSWMCSVHCRTIQQKFWDVVISLAVLFWPAKGSHVVLVSVLGDAVA